MGLFNNFDNSADQAFHDGLVNETISLHGIDTEYWTMTFVEKDSIYGEDTKPTIDGRYKIQAYTETIQENWILTRFGFDSEDLLQVQFGVTDFTENVGRDPLAGDYVWIRYMGRLFRVTDVDKEDIIFQQNKYCWVLHLKSANISGDYQDPALNIAKNYETLVDPQNDNDAITAESSAIVMTKAGDTNPFGAWE